MRVAGVDIGTVTTRLILAELDEGGALNVVARCGSVTDLGEGVDATGAFCSAAIDRVVETCRSFAERIAAFRPAVTLLTLTSAARDASNAHLLLERLEALGFSPEVIPGEVEARLTFLGVAADFAGERIAVMDSGGGSTEFALGSAGAASGPCALERTVSLDIGCRRVTERFLGAGGRGERAARTWAREQFAGFWGAVPETPSRLVAVGGTVTTLVAVQHELDPYDSAFVHLHALSLAEVDALADRFSGMSVAEIAACKGMEPKRAPVIRAGAIVVGEALRAGGYTSLTVSENGLLVGLARAGARLAESGSSTGGVLAALSC